MDKQMLTTILISVIAIFASSGFWAFLTSVFVNRKEKKSGQNQMLLGLAHDRIYALCKKYVKRGWLTTEEYDNLQYLYQPYLQMGGNGTGKKLMGEVEKLPIKSEQQGEMKE